jgi:hypothetical protein
MNSANKKTRRPSEPKTVHLPAHGRSLNGIDDAGTLTCGRRVKRCPASDGRQLRSFRVALPPLVH